MASAKSKKRSPAEIVRAAREQAEELLGKEVEAISGISRDGTRGWTVTLDVLELERIPPTTSLLGTYEAKLDADGDLLEVRRVRRYARNQADPPQQQQEER